MRVPVWVEGWQHQCCGNAFRVGSLVCWRLTTDPDDFVVEALGDRAPSWSATLPVIDPSVGNEERTGWVAGGDGLSVFVPASEGRAEPAAVQLRLLREDHHIDIPSAVPATTGTVTTVSVVRFEYALRHDEKALWPVPGGAELERTMTAEKWPVERVDGRDFAGFLVDLEVHDDAHA